MRVSLAVVVTFLCGLFFYLVYSGEGVLSIQAQNKSNEVIVQNEPDTTFYIQRKNIELCDGCECKRWVLDTLYAKIDTLSIESIYTIRIEFDSVHHRKETLFLFPKHLALRTEYTIPEDTNWYCDIRINATQSNKGIHTFAGIYNYKDSVHAEYIHDQSPCKIEIEQ